MKQEQHESINIEEFPILEGRYVLIKKIGSGATCSVKLAKDLQTDNIYAVKLLKSKGGRSTSIQDDKIFKAEMENLKKIQHRNIIGIIEGSKGIIKKPDGKTKMKDYIVLEIASNGELFDFLYFSKKGFGEYYARYLYTELINGIEACHKAGVAHRDLKTENIMMNEQWVLKLADFGYSTILQGKTGNGILSTPLGTLSYAAPEILNKKPYFGKTADIFSSGVILFVLVNGKLPFGKALVYDNYYRNFIRNDYEGFWTLIGPKLDPVSDEFKSLINSILAADPAQRPTVEEIKNHPWMKKNMASEEEMAEEFEKRKGVVKQMRELEAQQQQLEKKNRVVRTGGYKGEGEEITFIEEADRNIDDWVDTSNPYKLRIKGGDADQILNDVYEYFMKVDKKEKRINVSKSLYKLNVKYELEKEVKELEIDVDRLQFEVMLTRSDEDIIVEFMKRSGEKFEFYEVFENFVEKH